MAFQGLRRSLISLNKSDPAFNNLIEEEKDTIAQLRKLAKEIGDGSVYMAKWGEEEHFDLKDVCSQFAKFSRDIESAFTELAEAYSNYRSKLKLIRSKAEEVHELEKKHKEAAEKLKKAKANSKPFDMLEREEAELNMQLMALIANYEGSKRALLQEGIEIQFNAWKLFAGKIGTVSHFGLHMAHQIPQGILGPGDSLPPYLGSDTTAKIRDDCESALNDLGKCNQIQRPASAMSSRSSNGPARTSLSNSTKNVHLSVENMQEARYSRPQTPLPPAVSPRIAPTEIQLPGAFAQPSAPPSVVQKLPELPINGQNYLDSRSQASLTRSRYSSLNVSQEAKTNVTFCAFCENLVDLVHMKEHLDSDCKAFIHQKH